jgi:hypothetical protein
VRVAELFDEMPLNMSDEEREEKMKKKSFLKQKRNENNKLNKSGKR